MDIAVAPFDPPDEAALDDAYRIRAAAQAVDTPDVPAGDRAEFGLVAAHPPYGNLIHRALARRGGAAVGYQARQIERFQALRGRRRYHLGAVHEQTGRLVAWTMVQTGPFRNWHGSQEITIVDPAHRGRRLGLLVKIENLRQVLAREPELRVIDTWNAAVNDHMVSINEQLGYRVAESAADWQLTL
ncbi:hypothetical protein [Micromonospora sp. NPDC047134]|uniref:hypothetical protein n=1 Tax=Micromonospora sp. NPDC047134 TaxID=3154340 RepID=UPI0034116CE7